MKPSTAIGIGLTGAIVIQFLFARHNVLSAPRQSHLDPKLLKQLTDRHLEYDTAQVQFLAPNVFYMNNRYIEAFRMKEGAPNFHRADNVLIAATDVDHNGIIDSSELREFRTSSASGNLYVKPLNEKESLVEANGKQMTIEGKPFDVLLHFYENGGYGLQAHPRDTAATHAKKPKP